MGSQVVICPKCGKSAWAFYVMSVTGKYGQVYRYKVYRHPDGRRKTPRQCTVRLAAAPEEVGQRIIRMAS
ncbi:MAG: hypothetical protein ABSB26_06760 [Nitrososphaerales archaeon]